jgi:Protein of unknown function (DUF2891)
MARDFLLTRAQVSTFARLALANVEREFPHKLDHVMAGPEDVAAPRALHPAFFGSFDWHSCVHAHWLLLRLLNTQEAVPEAAQIRATLDAHLAPGNVRAEVAYLQRPASRAFERSYGWAWLLKLAEELDRAGTADASRWARGLAPLAAAIGARYLAWLRVATYPIRHGVHANTAFALAFALDYAHRCDAGDLRAAASAKARAWYLEDRDAPAAWEPSGTDFLSPSLTEAALMRRVLEPGAFAAWLSRFLPHIERRQPAALFVPVTVSDRSDPYLVHLDGLNLARAWCWRDIAAALTGADPRQAIARDAARLHLTAGLAALESSDYVGTHWLATFAVLALTT